MSHKLLDLYPKILSQSEKNLDLSKFTALALPVIPGDKVELVKSKLLKEITEFTKLNLPIFNPLSTPTLFKLLIKNIKLTSTIKKLLHSKIKYSTTTNI